MGRLVMAGVWAAILLGACLEPSTVECADGSLCPAGFSCQPDGSCASEAQVAACAELAEGAACTIPGVDAGTCRAGVCVAPRCGNGVLEPASGEQCDAGDANAATPDAPCRPDCQPQRCGDGTRDSDELCDDFNQIAGDGCASDCASLETCGNDYLDTVVGEQCDVGAGLNGDGCASSCRIEIDTGRRRPPAALERTNAAAATGPGGAPLVFGGLLFETKLGDTLQWSGEGWVPLHPPTAPAPRDGAAMAYDRVRDQVVLYGGRLGDGQIADDTWTFDGTTWTEVATATSPGGRSEHALAYDTTRQRVVLFGGDAPGGASSDETWEFDGADWTRRELATSPSARSASAMTYDAAHGVVLLFGGTGFPPLADTWEWDGGAAWVKRTPATVPPGGVDAQLSFDATFNAPVLVGGEGVGGAIANAWRWTGSNWVALASTPAPRVGHVLVPDASGATLLFAGKESYFDYRAETWRLSGASWTVEQATFEPGGRREAGLVYDDRRDRLVLFGGFAGDARLGDTWERAGDAWLLRRVAGPPERARAAMAFDGRRGETVLFGGFSNFGALADTWTWDGAAWTQRTPPTAPSERSGPSAAYDAARDRVVLFGGSDQADTWEWDGATWLERTPATSPHGRARAAMAYDRRRARVVLFGGEAYDVELGDLTLGDTWEWDGTAWTEHAVTPAPAARSGAAMAYDANRGEVVLLGGDGEASYLADAWAWDGTRWAALAPTDIFTPRSGAAAAFDARRAAVVAVAGSDGGNDTSEVWEFRLASASAPPEACQQADADTDADGLHGCDDPDCWSRCTPACAPGATCDPSAPRCGDGACNEALEDYVLCPADCGGP